MGKVRITPIYSINFPYNTHRRCSMEHKDWHKRVYRRRIKNFISKDEWHKLRMACLRRDNFTCQRCEKTSRQGMQAHHMIPRDEDGADDLSNLITLCNTCHDIVEISGYRTVADIIGSYEEAPVKELEQKPIRKTEEGYSFIRPDWHKYVYGGVRHSD